MQAYTNRLEHLVDERTNALRRANEQLELILNTTTDALAFAQPNGDILLANNAFLTMFDERAKDAIENILPFIPDAGQTETICDALLKVIYNQETRQLEATVISGENRELDIDMTLIPVHISETETRPGILWSGHDITHVKELERFKARFVADALHDLATPIAGLSTRLYLLKARPEKLADHVHALENQVEHLRNLLQDLRTLAQMDRREIELSITLYNINEVVERVFHTYEPVALDKRQTLIMHTDPGLPHVQVDPRQIERVLVNLLANAVNYTPPDKRLGIETFFEAGDVVIRVTDEGIGISVEDQAHIFDRFFRTSEARKSVTNGTGLGLAITREIIELHGGSIAVASELGQGSIFTIRLPLRR